MSNVLRESTQWRSPSFFSTLLRAPPYYLAFHINKNNVSISGAEAWGDECTQHAPLRSHSRLPRLLSISRIFSNYIWNTITPHFSDFHVRQLLILKHIITHMCKTSSRAFDRLLVVLQHAEAILLAWLPSLGNTMCISKALRLIRVHPRHPLNYCCLIEWQQSNDKLITEKNNTCRERLPCQLLLLSLSE